MPIDRDGLEMSGSAEAVAAYDRALAHLLRFQPEVASAAEAALAADPGCVMARALRAYVSTMSSEWSDTRSAAELVSIARASNQRERAHLEAISRWVAGDLHGAGRVLDQVLDAHPGDLLALAVGHQVDFFTGDAAGLRGRVERAKRRLDPAHPAAGFVDGMWAFGLEESGDYVRALEAGLRAVETNPDDVWGIHAVVHTYEMQGRVAEGIAFLEARRRDWMEGTFLNVHNAWHLALYELERDDVPAALAIYDSVIHHAASPGVAMEMLDGSSLLWRLHLDGASTGDRFRALADAWRAKDPSPWYVFNDLHAIMAFVGADLLDEADAVVKRLADFARMDGAIPSNHLMVVGAGLRTARALVAFGRGRYADVVEQLAPVRHHLSVFGGSHAQRDAYQRTLVEAALRSGESTLATQLLDERLEARPTSTWAWGRRARFLGQSGDLAGADDSIARREGYVASLRAVG